MAINVVIPFLIDLEENIINATRLFPSSPPGPLNFEEIRYCSIVPENAPRSARVANVTATHAEELPVQYSITGGNRDGLFTIDRKSGFISLAAHLDYELNERHLLEVTAESGGQKVRTSLHVLVADVNDTPPYFEDFKSTVTVIEEDDRNLPKILTKAIATDPDLIDENSMLYSVEGEGVSRDTPGGPIFTINPTTGEVLLLRAVDRDPPFGRSTYKIKVIVQDGNRIKTTKRKKVKQGRYDVVSRAKRKTRDTEVINSVADADEEVGGGIRVNRRLEHKRQKWKQKHEENSSFSDVTINTQPELTTTSSGESQKLDLGWHEIFKLPTEANRLEEVTEETKDFFGVSEKTYITKFMKKRTNTEEEDVSQISNNFKDIFEQHSQYFEPSVNSKITEPNQLNISKRKKFSVNIEKPEQFKCLKKILSTLENTSFLRDETKPGKSSCLFLLKIGKKLVQNFEQFPKKFNTENFELNSNAENFIFELWLKFLKWFDASEIFSKYDMEFTSKCFQTNRLGNDSVCFCLWKEIYILFRNIVYSAQQKNIISDRHYIDRVSNFKYSSESFLNCQFYILLKSIELRLRDASYFNNNNIGLDSNLADNFKLSILKLRKNCFRTIEIKILKMMYPSKKNSYRSSTEGYYEMKDFDEVPSTSLERYNLSLMDFQNGPIDLEKNISDISSIFLDRRRGGESKQDISSRSGILFPVIFSRQGFPTDFSENLTRMKLSTEGEITNLSVSITEENPASPETKNRTNRKTEDGRNIEIRDQRTESEEIEINRIKRETWKEELEIENSDDKKQFCVLTDPRIQMSKHEGSFASQYEKFAADKDLTPFLSRIFMESSDQHETSIVVTIIVKDINDNAPVFPNVTMYGEVQENGPIDLSVVTVTAWDADDATSGTNALLTYSLEKNVVDEKTGEPLFSIHPRTGELRTALCCLDRETTPEYRVQVVASDGGGLKGSGTVVVRLADVNDNSPRLSREEWNVVVDETSENDPPSNDTLLEISVTDPDISNYFFYRVVSSSGKGWNYFGIRTVGSIGELYATKSLDYENKDHKDGFQFDVQVTDRGPGGWNDSRHVDMAHVTVVLRDVNDNDPIFQTKELHVTVKEDVPINELLATLPATDIDENLNGRLDYHLKDNWGNLRIDETGGVRVWQPLDREGVGGDLGVVRVVAVDRGTPRRSATVTLTVSLLDVNDCPPRLQLPHVFHVLENTPSQEVCTLRATDDDIWAEGNGPPFLISLAESNPEALLDKISLTFDPNLDSGRGGATLWTLKPLDREEHSSLTVEIALSDSRGLVTSQPIYLVIDDVNDNMMKPGNKTVYLWKTREAGLDASLGRIFVEDPDDWDLKDKSFRWFGAPHPLFSLDKETGLIFASGLIREGKYDLEFAVSDRKWNQQMVRGNVTVIVRLLSQDAVTHAVPLILSPASPNDLTRDWNPMGGGGTLGSLLQSVKEIIDAKHGTAVIVSVYSTSENEGDKHYDPSAVTTSREIVSASRTSTIRKTHIWISYQEDDLSFMNPVKLRGILEMNLDKIRDATNLIVNLDSQSKRVILSSSSLSPTSPSIISNSSLHPGYTPQFLPKWSDSSPSNPTSGGYASATSLASTALPLQVVDNNSTSFVTPRLSPSQTCFSLNSNSLKKSDECLPDSCLNGGICASSERGKRCVCPGGTLEPFCKISSRSFRKGGWAWIKPVPSCVPTSISLNFITPKPDGVILYSGPLTPYSSSSGDRMTPSDVPNKRQKYPNKFTDFDSSSNFNLESGGDPHFPSREGVGASSGRKASPLFALYLSEGRVHLSVEGTGESVHLVVNSTESLNDGKWHSVHVLLDDKRISLRVGYCSHVTSDDDGNLNSCVANHYWSFGAAKKEFWISSGPLQIGGLAQRTPKMVDHGWGSQPVGSSLEGCISDLRIGGELMDLGAPAYSNNSQLDCDPQKHACIPRCGGRAICDGGLGIDAYCKCPPGLTGHHCDSPTVPVSLESESFAKVALSFTPDPFSISFQLRMRTRSTDATVLFLTSQESKTALVLKLQRSFLCFSFVDLNSAAQRSLNRVSRNDKPPQAVTGGSDPLSLGTVSLEGISVNDGVWHTIKGGKYGDNLLLEVDGGDSGERNETLLEGALTPEFKLDVREGVTIGGFPHFTNGVLTRVEGDLADSCLDDLRIQGKQVPLPMALNETKWGQVTTFRRFKTKCIAPDSCEGKDCKPPLVCRDEWRRGACRCPPGQQVTASGCQEMDMCLFGPCLNGGSCVQDKTGMACLCKPQFTGQNCEWEISATGFISLLNPIAAVVFVSALVFLASFVIICCVKLRRKRKRRRREEEGGIGVETPIDTKLNRESVKESGDLEISFIYDQSGGSLREEERLRMAPEEIIKREMATAIKEGGMPTVKNAAGIHDCHRMVLVDPHSEICPKIPLALEFGGEGTPNGSIFSPLVSQQRLSYGDLDQIKHRSPSASASLGGTPSANASASLGGTHSANARLGGTPSANASASLGGNIFSTIEPPTFWRNEEGMTF